MIVKLISLAVESAIYPSKTPPFIQYHIALQKLPINSNKQSRQNNQKILINFYSLRIYFFISNYAVLDNKPLLNSCQRAITTKPVLSIQ